MNTLLLSILLSAATGMAAEPGRGDHASAQAQIDYAGFVQLSGELEGYRRTRLIPLAEFNRMAQQPGVLILDTRSAAAYAQGHIEGAVNLPFSDFTDDKLAEVIGDVERPILIYCNNNFLDNIAPVMTKRVELALNIPTFINLYGYGYRNIYELGDLVSIRDPEVRWLSGPE